MTPKQFFEDLSGRIAEALAKSPAKDIEKNLRALLNAAFTKLDLVTREEFDVQREVLVRTRARLQELEQKVAELERSGKTME